MKQKLQNLNPDELDETLQNEINDLIQRYVADEINSYQARVFFYDQIRDIIPIKVEMYYRNVMEVKISDVILKGVQNPSSEDIEHGMTLIGRKFLSNSSSQVEARIKFNSVIRSLSIKEKAKWLNLFNDLLKRIREEEESRKKHWANRFRQLFMVLESFSILILIPLIVTYFVTQISFSWWLDRLIFAVCALMYLLLCIQYLKYYEWKKIRIKSDVQ